MTAPNPPAFPRSDFHSDTHYTAPAQDGMSLRDWFAGQLLPAVYSETIQNVRDGCAMPELKDIAGEVLAMANALLAASQSQP